MVVLKIYLGEVTIFRFKGDTSRRLYCVEHALESRGLAITDEEDAKPL